MNLSLFHLFIISLSPTEVLRKQQAQTRFLPICLRFAHPTIYSSLCAVFNKYLLLGKMPSSSKESNIVPILKGGTVKEV